MEISNARAIISGGASGLGRAVAEKIVAAGGQVTLLDVNKEAGAAAASELGANASFLTADVSDDAQVIDATEKAAESMAGINLCVSCAGIIGASRVLGREGPMPGDFFAKVISINLNGTFFLSKAAASHMERNDPDKDGARGVIIGTASVAAYEGQIGQCAYSASKSGVIGMMLPMAREFSRIGVRVMTIAPGIFMTPMMAGMSEEIQQSLGAQVPFPPRLGKPEEFADLVESICRNPMLNGETIRLDGAIRMQPK